jgi:hypothetical protein
LEAAQEAAEEEMSVEGAVRRLCAHLDPLMPALAERGVTVRWMCGCEGGGGGDWGLVKGMDSGHHFTSCVIHTNKTKQYGHTLLWIAEYIRCVRGMVDWVWWWCG